MLPTTRFQQLSAPRQALVRLCQRINFGRIEDLELRGGEPVFSPAPQVFIDVRLDWEDFAIPEEMRRLLARLDAIQDGNIERIEVRAGIPRRLIVEFEERP